MVRRTRPAYTLMEIVMVLAVLVILGALAIPVIDSMQAAPRITAATDMVRARWSEAQRRAVEERRAYRFAVKHNTGMFKIAPDTTQYWPDSANSEDGSAQPGLVVERSLPDKVIFTTSGSTTSGSPTSGSPNGMAPSTSSGGGDWHVVVTFQADGTSIDDVELSMRTEGTAPATLRLQGATGAVSTAALASDLNQH
jgi:Tfp pilus assembly protein FimT